MQLALGIAGAVVGSFFGAPQVGFLIGSMIGGLLDPPKQEGPRLQELNLQRSTYGRMFPFLWGTIRVAGDVIDQTDLEEHKQKSGGKGGPEVTTYTYSASFDIALCASKRFGDPACLGILRIWADARLIWDSVTSEDPMPCTFYDGTETQLPDPTFEAIHGVGNVPAYRGLAHAVFADFFLTDFGNRIPNFEFEVYTGSGDYPWQVSLGRGSVPGYSYSYADGEITVIAADVGAGFMDVTVSKYDIDMNEIMAPTTTTIPNAGVAGSNINGIDQIYSSLYGIGWWRPNQVGIMVQYGADISVEWLANNNGTSGGNYGVQQGDYYYSLKNLSPTYINKWTPGGGHDAQAVVGTMNANTCSMGTSDTDHVYVFHDSGAGAPEMFKYDSDLNLVYYWDSAQITADLGALHPLVASGTRGNFFVYKDQLAFNKQVGSNKWIHLVNIGPAPTYTLSDDPAHELAQSAVGRIAHLTGGLCMNINVGVFSLDPPAGPELLSTIVGDITDMKGSQIAAGADVSDLTDEVRGFRIDSPMTKRNAIQPLRQGFFFSACEEDGQVKFFHDSEAAQFSIPDDDLCARQYGEASGDPLLTHRKREQQVVRSITLEYIDQDRDYQTSGQSARRQTSLSEQDVNVQLPIVFTADEAKQRAEILLTKSELERETFEWATTRKWAHLSPCAVVLVRGRVIRITNRRETPSGVITWNGDLAAPSIVTSAAGSIYYQPSPGHAGDNFIPPTPPASRTDTDLTLLDIPLMRDGYGASAVGHPAVVVPHSNSGAWSGAEVFKSIDGGSTYNSIGSSLVPDVVGLVASPLPDFTGGNVFDQVHTIRVAIYSKDGELSSATREAVQNGANLFALGTPANGFELGQFMTATLVSADPDVYDLTSLRRGRRGTNKFMATHIADEMFILLPPTIDVAGVFGELGLSRKYKAVTFGNTLADADAQDWTNNGVALKPYAPSLLGAGVLSDGTLRLTWHRRTRIGGTWLDFTDVPLGEASEAYEVNLYSSSAHTTILLTYNAVSEEAEIDPVVLGLVYGSPVPFGSGHWGVKQRGSYGYGYESFGTF